jgi:hypothetical protein
MAAALLAGCRAPQRKDYRGPTLPMNQLVARINASTEKVTTLRGAGKFSVEFIEEGSRLRRESGDVTFLYARPQSLRLVGRHPLAGQVFDIGSNDERYWVMAGLKDSPDATMWWGTYANLDQVDPKQIPVRPDLILEVLAVQPISTDFLQPPVPVMRFNNHDYAYMVVWHARLIDRWVAVKEVWYDVNSLLPTMVLLFDEHGRIVLRAYLSEHQPVEVPGLPEEQWPKVATVHQLFFPETGAKIRIELSQELALKGGRPEAPNRLSFVFPGNNAGASRVIELDGQSPPMQATPGASQ